MTKHFCDRCQNETNWKDMVHIYFNDADTGNIIYPNLELCKTCADEVVTKIKKYAKEAKLFV